MFKHKARLNIYVGKQEYTANLFEAFSPVVTWFTIRMVLVLSIIDVWSPHQVDLVLAFRQADIEFDMYTDIPQVIEKKAGSRTMHVLKIINNLYG